MVYSGSDKIKIKLFIYYKYIRLSKSREIALFTSAKPVFHFLASDFHTKPELQKG